MARPEFCLSGRRAKVRSAPTPHERASRRGCRKARLGLAPPLTAREVRELKARAAAGLRTIGSYVSHLVAEELKRKGRTRVLAPANPGDKRRPYSIALYLTAAERKRLETMARAERQSVSGYVARVIVDELAPA